MVIVMIEKFRDWNPRKLLSIRYTTPEGHKDTWSCDQRELLATVVKITDEYQAKSLVLTQRQLYYQLVAKDIIPNAMEVYKRLSIFTTDARYAGLIDWDAIEDRGRKSERKSQWSGIKELIETAVLSYRKHRWDDQEYYIELFCEKQALEGVLKPIADKYHLHFGSNKGYSSSSAMYELYERVLDQMGKSKKVVILYLGDHDPSGKDMVRDIYTRIREFLIEGDYAVDPDVIDEYERFKVHALALTMEQICEFNPPPNPAKIKDPRAKAYIKEFGEISWELDALTPENLVYITENGILQYIELSKYVEAIDQEQRDVKALREFGEKFK